MNKQELDKIKNRALEEHIPIIMDDTLQTIRTYLENKKVDRFLEIGTAVGYSAICFTEFLSDNGRIDTIERDKERVKEAKINIKNMNLENTIRIYEGDALEILPELNEKYDVIFIDAAKGQYLKYLKNALRLINKRGIIIADNVLFKGRVLSDYNEHRHRTATNRLREYLKIINEDERLDSHLFKIGDGVAVSIVR